MGKFLAGSGVFAWLIFPFLGALLAVPQGSTLGALLSVDPAASWKAIGFGALWGVGGLTFGLSMRYLGVALGQSIALGTCSAFGTLIPALFFDKQDLLHGDGLILLLGVCITLVGIAVIGYAGGLRAQNMTEEQKKAAIKDFALTKGLLVALLAGVMSACFALGLSAGQPIADAAKSVGANDLFATLPTTLMVTLGGFSPMPFIVCRKTPKIRASKTTLRTAVKYGLITCCSALWQDYYGIRNFSACRSVKVFWQRMPLCWLFRGVY